MPCICVRRKNYPEKIPEKIKELIGYDGMFIRIQMRFCRAASLQLSFSDKMTKPTFKADRSYGNLPVYKDFG